ncbi:MAG: hypothetical protein ACRD50_16905 [Candidatus Acidiferrales bacterium]
MFCPECKAEYRSGFTRCADCDADLVDSLDASSASGSEAFSADSAESNDLSPEEFIAPQLLWSGVDTAAFTRIRSELDEAGIAYNDERLDSRLLYASMRHPLEIWVQRADMQSARKVLDGQSAAPTTDPEALGALQTSAHGDEISGEVASAAGSLPDDLEDESNDLDSPLIYDVRAVEIWSGNDINMAQILKDCLRENGIAALMEQPIDSPQWRVAVRPEREARAREILREILDAAPPE